MHPDLLRFPTAAFALPCVAAFLQILYFCGCFDYRFSLLMPLSVQIHANSLPAVCLSPMEVKPVSF